MVSRDQCLKSNSYPIPSRCDFCDRKAEFVIRTTGFVTVKTAFVCKEHDKSWHHNTLNI